MKAHTHRSPQEVRTEFLHKGLTITKWATDHGFDAATVSQVLSGRNLATRGVGHKIAVMLGIKNGEIVDEGSNTSAAGSYLSGQR